MIYQVCSLLSSLEGPNHHSLVKKGLWPVPSWSITEGEKGKLGPGRKKNINNLSVETRVVVLHYEFRKNFTPQQLFTPKNSITLTHAHPQLNRFAESNFLAAVAETNFTRGHRFTFFTEFHHSGARWKQRLHTLRRSCCRVQNISRRRRES